jgi:putative DNA primase/helicase
MTGIPNTLAAMPPVNINNARLFLNAIDPSAAFYHFRLIKKGQAPVNTTDLDKCLRLNQQGYDAFVMVNKLRDNAPDQTAENIEAVRSLFIDQDSQITDLNEYLKHFRIKPSMVVNTSPNKYHLYFFVTDWPLEQFKPVQQHLARMYNADPTVCDLPRIMRLPGCIHWKGEPFLSRLIGELLDFNYEHDEIADAFDFNPLAVSLKSINNNTETEVSDGSQWNYSFVKELLTYIEPIEQSYNDWMKLSFALKSYFINEPDLAHELFHWFSEQDAARYKKYDCETQINNASAIGDITFGTLRQMAINGGADIAKIKARHRKGTTIFGPILDSNCGEQVEPPKYGSFDDALAQCNIDPDAERYCLEVIRVETSAIAKKGLINQLCDTTSLTKTELREALKASKPDAKTHSQLATEFITTLDTPVGAGGRLWVYEKDNSIFIPFELTRVAAEIGKFFSKEPLCRTQSHYKQLSDNIYAQITDEGYFDNEGNGILTPKGYYTVEKNQIFIEKPSSDHRIRHKVEISPVPITTPLFTSMLQDAFGDTYLDQSRQLQQMLGLVLFGLQHKTQKCLFLKGKAGSGKSILLKIISSILPKESISNVSPLELNQDTKRTMLSGKRANLCGEIDNSMAIPAAEFKMLTGDDTITGRFLYQNPFTFTSKAGNWFNGNSFLSTKDRTEGFWRRWSIIEFFHGKPTDQRDPDLADKIVNTELAGILNWAIDGLADYLQNGLHQSATHYKALATWKGEADSVLAWLKSDDCAFVESVGASNQEPVRRADIYEPYRLWCMINGYRTPALKKNVYNSMENTGHQTVKIDGHYVYKSLIRKPTFLPVVKLSCVN